MTFLAVLSQKEDIFHNEENYRKMLIRVNKGTNGVLYNLMFGINTIQKEERC